MITGIILASGFSRRMNRQKLMLNVGGLPIIERVIRAAKYSHIDEVILVYQNEEIREIAEKYGVKTVYNEKAAEGQSAAVKLGISSSHPGTDGFMFLVGDQPYLSSATINTLIDIFKRERHPVVVPIYAGKRGNPVIFSSILKDALYKLQGDCGGRVIIDQMPESVKLVNIKNSLEGVDIDTQEAYEKIRCQQYPGA